MSRKSQRSADEREAARRERERRRAEREGHPIPPEVVDPEPEAPFDAPAAAADPMPPAASVPEPYAHTAAEAEPAAPELDPQATQQWDVEVDWSDEPQTPSADPSPPADDLAAGPAAAAATADAIPPSVEPERGPEPDPDATQAHPVPDAPHPHPHEASDAPDWGATWRDEDPATGPAGPDVPIGTRRVTGYRPSLPHLHRSGRGAPRDRSTTPGRGRPRMRRPGELGPPRSRTSWGGRMAGGVVVVLVLVIGWFLVSLFQPFGSGDGSGSVRVRIPQGASAGDIGTLLANKGVVSSGFFFNLRATISGDRGDLKSGTYTLRRDMSYAAALTALTASAPAPPPTVKLTIPEGRSRRETVSLVRRAGLRGDYLTATRRSRVLSPRRFGAPANATLEGFLFPATYELRRGADVQALVGEQLSAFKDAFRSVDLGYAKSKNLSAYDVLTIASMVEREVSVPKERPLVAAVIYNRLAQGIPLGIDATLRYEQNDWVNPLKQSVLDANTPFNTRIRPGLPPGPIGSPGLASIKAAAHPARVGYLYYVVDACKAGQHVFANTYDEHLANVARYEHARQAAGGRGLKC